jgi:transcriptional regulator with XRE-family HTH domain
MTGKPKKAPEENFYRDLGKAIRLARVAAGKSQMETAEHLDLSFQQLQKYEKGINRVPVQELLKLAVYYEVSLSDLVDSPDADRALKSLAGKFTAKGFHTLLESWGAIKDQPMRAAILQLVKCAAALSRPGR